MKTRNVDLTTNWNKISFRFLKLLLFLNEKKLNEENNEYDKGIQ